MAAPWHPEDMVNNSCYVAFQPLRRLAAWWWTGHNALDHVLDGALRGRPDHSKPRPAGSRPGDIRFFGGFAYARRRQGRLRSVFRRPAWRSGGILRRHAEIRRGDPQSPG